MKIKDIAEYEDTDSVLAQYTISDLHHRINKAIEVLKDTNVDMDSILLCETIGYAIHILKGEK